LAAYYARQPGNQAFAVEHQQTGAHYQQEDPKEREQCNRHT
jgi:hypothetical protein